MQFDITGQWSSSAGISTTDFAVMYFNET